MSANDERPLTDEERAEWEQMLAEARKNRKPDTVERTWGIHRDGTKELLSTVVYPADPIPGVVYDDHGVPDGYATADLRRRQELEAKERSAERARSKGGRTRKYASGIQAVVDSVVAEAPTATAQEVWDSIPSEAEAGDVPSGGFIVYRDGERVVQIDDSTGRERAILFSSFQRYVQRARTK